MVNKEEYKKLERKLREIKRELESSNSRYKEKKYAVRRVEEEVRQSKLETKNVKKVSAKALGVAKLIIEYWKKRAERGEEDAKIHFEALTETSKRFNENKLKWWVGVFHKKLLDLNTVRNWTIEHNEKSHNAKTKDLEEKISISQKNYEDQSKLLIKVRDNLRKEEEKNQKLQKKSEEEKQELLKLLQKTRNKLKEQEEQNQKFQEQLNLHSTPTPSPTKKRKNEEVESQHIEKKIKVQNQVTVAQIEIKKH